MPFIDIPTKARDCLLEHAKMIRDLRASGAHPRVLENKASMADGMFKLARALYPSEVTGLLVMDYDQVLEGKEIEDTFTERLPRVNVEAKS